MGSEAAQVRRMRLGQLQAAALTSIGIGEIDAALKGLQSIPMAFRSVEEQQYVLSRMRPMLERRLLERGFVTLFWADAGWVRYFSRSAVTSPDELRRLKIFVTAGDDAQPDLMRAEGFSPVQLEWSDALTALRTGMIDAIPVIPFYALTMQLYTVASHMVALDWQLLLGGAVISRSAWESLLPEDQEAMRRAAAEAGRQFQSRGRLEGDSAVAAMQRRGLTVHTLSPEGEAEWLAMCERLYTRIRGTLVPADIFDEVMRLRAEYRRQPGGRE
jgi:TRAP-type C4-dicarboxylate transport system substrate-binding protein